jgi:hypothetical protein
MGLVNCPGPGLSHSCQTANRSQRVKIRRTISNSKFLESGVPQEGILSPNIFVIYGADMELWLKHSSALTYADDTCSSVTGNKMIEVKEKLETDASWVPRFSNTQSSSLNYNGLTLELKYLVDSSMEMS